MARFARGYRPRRSPRPRRRMRGVRGFSAARCGCPAGSKKISTRGRGRGFVCQSTSFKRIKGRKLKPFVKATCR